MRAGSTGKRVAGLGILCSAVAATTMLALNPVASPTAAAARQLEPFEDCETLRQWYVDAALPLVTAWGMESPLLYAGPAAMEDSAAGSLRGLPDATPDVAVDNGATGTNVQEEGVDEPDIAKTNGEIAVVLRQGHLVVYDVTGAVPVEVSRLGLSNRQRATELLLVGDKVLLLSPGAVSYPGPIMLNDRSVTSPDRWNVLPRTTVTTVDMADPARPFIADTRTMEGSIISAREHSGIVRVVLSSTPSFDFVYPMGSRSTQEALARNRQIVRESTAQDWLPGTWVSNGTQEEPLLDCTDVRHPAVSSATSTITVMTLDPSHAAVVDVTAVSADGDLVYAALDRLYVATSTAGWGWDWGWRELPTRRLDTENLTTDIHAFSIDGPETEYVASGTVDGAVSDRWAFSEHEGNLRLASTVGPTWSPRETVVSVLEEDGAKLRIIGSVGGLGEDEQVHAVRWFDDVAIVVTFRQVDPLYTVDLTDPTKPAVTGELKIPGFSEYLHPLGGDMVLGVGQDATVFGGQRGAQLSTFDIADIADVDRVATLGLGKYATSPVEQDSRAFTYLPEQRLAFIPVSGSRGGNDVAVARVSAQGGLDLVTSIELDGWGGDARVLPLDDDRVAVVSQGEITDILDVTLL